MSINNVENIDVPKYLVVSFDIEDFDGVRPHADDQWLQDRQGPR